MALFSLGSIQISHLVILFLMLKTIYQIHFHFIKVFHKALFWVFFFILYTTALSSLMSDSSVKHYLNANDTRRVMAIVLPLEISRAPREVQGPFNCPNFTGQHQSEAKALQDKLLDFEVILTAFIYLRIFKHTTPLSDYLQTAGLNYVRHGA